MADIKVKVFKKKFSDFKKDILFQYRYLNRNVFPKNKRFDISIYKNWEKAMKSLLNHIKIDGDCYLMSKIKLQKVIDATKALRNAYKEAVDWYSHEAFAPRSSEGWPAHIVGFANKYIGYLEDCINGKESIDTSNDGPALMTW